MIKVMQISSDTNIGGAGKCILTYLKNDDKGRFENILVLPKGSKLKEEAEKIGVRIIEFDGSRDKSLEFSAIAKFKKLFLAEKPDIVHSHANMSARIGAKMAKVPKVVYTRHSFFEPSPRLTRGIGKAVNGFVNNHFADRIIAVAEAAKQNLTDTGVDPDKIEVVLNGVKAVDKLSENEKDDFRSRFDIGKEDFVVSIIARLVDIKGQDEFIRCAALVRQKHPNVKFVIAGTGPEEEAYKHLADEMELKDTVIFTGFLEDVTPLLNCTNLLANCSYGTEATSLSLLEGMSLGIPCVVTDYGGNRGVCHDGVNGFVVPVHDFSAMAEKINQIIADKELYQTLCENSLHLYQEAFTEEIMSKNIEKIYMEGFANEN